MSENTYNPERQAPAIVARRAGEVAQARHYSVAVLDNMQFMTVRDTFTPRQPAGPAVSQTVEFTPPAGPAVTGNQIVQHAVPALRVPTEQPVEQPVTEAVSGEPLTPDEIDQRRRIEEARRFEQEARSQG